MIKRKQIKKHWNPFMFGRNKIKSKKILLELNEYIVTSEDMDSSMLDKNKIILNGKDVTNECRGLIMVSKW